ncbi:MAG: glutathione peroxidase [Sphingomonadaceae bacterium]|nr:glutathione peroxidase [Sphingomonadaceae bacterium]
MLLDHQARLANGDSVGLDRWRGQVLLIVNTASQCGFTPQYAGLQQLYERYGPQGFAVLAFPCNQFGGQEPGTDAEIAGFCDLRFRASFPIFSKIEVNGPAAHPLWRDLTAAQPGLLGTRAVKWNFTKFLVNRRGVPVSRHGPQVKPEALSPRIEALLAEPAA